MTQFNVIYWNFNDTTPKPYDVLPYFRNQYKQYKRNRPKTIEEWKEFVRRWGRYQYWARCEYEVIVLQWPPTDLSHKLDVWQQIEPNIDLIAEILFKEHEGNSKSNTEQNI